MDQNNERNINFLNNVIVEGKKMKLKRRSCPWRKLAIALDLVVGDKINLLSSSFIDTPFGGLPKQDGYLVKQFSKVVFRI